MYLVRFYISAICLFFLVYFNKTSILSSKYTHDDIERHRFSRGFFPTYSLIFPVFSLSLFSFFHRNVTLVTAKKQHCGWNARTYAHLCVHARNAPWKFSLHFFPRFLFFLLLLFLFPHSPSLSSSSLLGHSILVSLCFAMCVLQICCFAKKKMHISLIFSRFGAISTHIQIEGCVVPPPICSETNDLYWILNSCDFLGRLTKKSYLCGSRRMSIYIRRWQRKKGEPCRPPQPFSLLPLLFSKGRLAIPTYRHARYHHLRPCP